MPRDCVSGTLENARAEIARHLADADPDLVTAARAAQLVTLCAAIERLGAAGKVLYAQRAAQSMVWRDEGHRCAASWMALTTGIGMGEALGTFETSAALGSLPETAQALRQGELSSPQRKVIAGAATADPRRQRALLDAAATGNLKGLKDVAAQVRATAQSAAEELAAYNARRAARGVRHWSDPDGTFRLDARLTPDAGATMLGALQVALVWGRSAAAPPESSRRAGSSRATVCIRVDAAALRRGHVQGGEICTIPGWAPSPWRWPIVSSPMPL